MSRTKVTAYVAPDLAQSIKLVAAIRDRSVSDIIEDAVAKLCASTNREAEQSAIMAKLDDLVRQLRVIERMQEAQVELTSQAARISMGVAPESPAADRQTFNARGAARLQALLGAVSSRLAAGRCTWREHFLAGIDPAPAGHGVAAE